VNALTLLVQLISPAMDAIIMHKTQNIIAECSTDLTMLVVSSLLTLAAYVAKQR